MQISMSFPYETLNTLTDAFLNVSVYAKETHNVRACVASFVVRPCQLLGNFDLTGHGVYTFSKNRGKLCSLVI